jgi:hypothetical protein
MFLLAAVMAVEMNQADEHDPGMHQTTKGSECDFGMMVHIKVVQT